jgi:hypothetical protein
VLSASDPELSSSLPQEVATSAPTKSTPIKWLLRILSPIPALLGIPALSGISDNS